MIDLNDVTIGQLVVLFGSLVAFIKFVDWAWGRFVTPRLKHDAVFKSMEQKLEKIDNKLTNDFVKLEQHDRRLENLEVRMKEQEKDSQELHNTLRILVVAMQAMIKSSLENGNNREGLEKAEDQLNNYLNSKV